MQQVLEGMANGIEAAVTVTANVNGTFLHGGAVVCMSEIQGRCDQSRASLQTAQTCVRSTKEPDELAAQIVVRDVAHKSHAIVLADAVQVHPQLQGFLQEVCDLHSQLSQFGEKLDAMKLDLPAYQALPADADVEVECKNAVAAYRDWKSDVQPGCVIQQTDQAVRAVRSALVESSLFEVDANCSTDDEGAERFETSVLQAAGAMDDEEEVWKAPVAGLLLTCSKAIIEVLKTRKAGMQQAIRARSRCAAELENLQSVAICPNNAKDVAVAAHKKELQDFEDATWDYQDAKVAYERAVKRKRDVEPLQAGLSSKRLCVSEKANILRSRTLMLAALAQDFPEVIHELRAGLPSCLLELWCECRTLANYSEVHRLEVVSRNAVYHVKDNGESAIVKEYPITSSALLTCFKEASLLHRLRHPHIVQVKAIFEDSNPERPCVYMEMPYYEHGQLDVWIKTQKPDVLSILRVLTQLLLAVAHLHHNGVLHNDIKPANVLIGSDGCAYLADFDISMDATARASHALLRATAAPGGGGTLGFIAPEVVQNSNWLEGVGWGCGGGRPAPPPKSNKAHPLATPNWSIYSRRVY